MEVVGDKPFDHRENERSDGFSKDVLLDWLRFKGWTDFEENPESKYTGKIWDIKATPPGGRPLRFDSEVKWEWTPVPDAKERLWTSRARYGYPFRWPSMDFPWRKRDKAEEHANLHVIVGGDGLRLFMVHRRILLSSPVGYKPVWNRGGAKEKFFFVSPAQTGCTFYEKRGAEWFCVYKGTTAHNKPQPHQGRL